MEQARGTIVQCVGAVTDIEFPRDGMPNIYDALKLEDQAEGGLAEKGLTFEVEQQLGDGIVRCIALGSSDGLRRGMTVVSTGTEIGASWTCSAGRSTAAARSKPTSCAPSIRPRRSSTR